ncbi:MAG: TetR/AcrR family transcriptional regulator [Lachnospiraceae bacterium]
MEREGEKRSVKSRIVSAAWKLFYEKGYNGTTVDDIIELSQTSKGSFYYYFNTKDELLNTLSMILDENYEELENTMDEDMDCFDKLMFLNYKAHTLMEDQISIDILASLYSTQLVATGQRHLLDQNRSYYKLITKVVEEGQKKGQLRDDVAVSDITKYYSMCERALVYDWCLNQGSYSLGERSKEWMPIMMEHFKK